MCSSVFAGEAKRLLICDNRDFEILLLSWRKFTDDFIIGRPAVQLVVVGRVLSTVLHMSLKMIFFFFLAAISRVAKYV